MTNISMVFNGDIDPNHSIQKFKKLFIDLYSDGS